MLIYPSISLHPQGINDKLGKDDFPRILKFGVAAAIDVKLSNIKSCRLKFLYLPNFQIKEVPMKMEVNHNDKAFVTIFKKSIKEDIHVENSEKDRYKIQESMTPKINIKEEFDPLSIKSEPEDFIENFSDTASSVFVSFGEAHNNDIDIKHELISEYGIELPGDLVKVEISESDDTELFSATPIHNDVTENFVNLKTLIPRNKTLLNRINTIVQDTIEETDDVNPVALDPKCRGCGKSFHQLIRHLQNFSYKKSPCMKYYSQAEIDNHKHVISNCSECDICHNKIHKAYLPMHKATVHFKSEYLEEIKRMQSINKVGPDSCPWAGCLFTMKNVNKDGKVIKNDNTMIKHYQSHYTVSQKEKKNNQKEDDIPIEEKKEEKNPKDTNLAAERKIYCKSCKSLFAVKSKGNLKFVRNENCQQCQNPNLSIVCRVCNLNIKSPDHFNNHQKMKHIEKHLDSDKHVEKEQIFETLIMYAANRGFSMESDINLDNLKFFLQIIKTKSTSVDKKHILPLLLNILNLSGSQYGDLQKHLDYVSRNRNPSFLCISCNFIVMNGIEDLKGHLATREHEQSISHLRSEGGNAKCLSCSKCELVFDVTDIDLHSGHRLYKEDVEIKPAVKIQVAEKPKETLKMKTTPEVNKNKPPPKIKFEDEDPKKESVLSIPLTSSDDHPCILDNMCRGCGLNFQRIVRHLQTSKKRGFTCMNKYSVSEIIMHKRIRKTIENLRQREKEKEVLRTDDKMKNNKNIFCKTCKQLFAYKSDGCVQFTSFESRSMCNQCVNPGLEIVCQVCNILVRSPPHFTLQQKREYIERHLDSDKHSQKEQVLESYRMYSKIKGFHMEKEIHLENLRFFLTAIKAKTLGGKVASKNSLAVIVNILDLSTSQYNDLHADLHSLVTARNPNYLCYSCNFHTQGGIEELRKHTQSEQHITSGSLERKNLSCSKCDVFFNMNTIDEHIGHELSDENIDSILKKQIVTNVDRKRKYPEDEDDDFGPQIQCSVSLL